MTLEAMASGLPTVCADATGSKSLVKHGTTGYLVQPQHTAAFLDATARLVSDDGLRRTMGAAAHKRATAFAWDTILARMVTYYDEVLQE